MPFRRAARSAESTVPLWATKEILKATLPNTECLKTLKPEPECVAFQLPVPSAEPAARRKRTQDFDIQLCLFQCPTRSPFGVRRFDRIPSLRT